MSVEITTLPSGLRVVTDAMPHLETAALGVWIGAGSRHETAREHGLSHLLEHMAFKGTRRRSARAIAEEIEAAGGDLNAALQASKTAKMWCWVTTVLGIIFGILLILSFALQGMGFMDQNYLEDLRKQMEAGR